jgi:hypothetical protein
MSAALAVAVVLAVAPAANAAGQANGRHAERVAMDNVSVGLPTVVAAGGHATGEGFDTSLAPPTSTIRAWSASPYRTVNMYFAGSERYRTVQPELSPSWVTTVLANGWNIIPTDVDLQAPCASTTKQKISTDPSTALAEGASAASLAIDDPSPGATSLTQLGLPTGVPVYIDIESYSVPAGNTTCVPAVQAFVRGWIDSLHDAGYLAGLYGNPTSGIKDVKAAHTADSSYPQPDAIWFARYDGNDSVDNANIPSGYLPHHRIHQYESNTQYTYGGLPLTIDKDALDGDVVTAASVTLPSGPPYVYAAEVPVGLSLTERAGPSAGTAATSTYNDGDQLAIDCQTIAAAGDAAGIVSGDSVWDRLTNGHFVSDIYTTTTGGTGFSSAIPRCDTTPPAVTVTPVARATTASSGTVSFHADDPSGVAAYDVSWRRARYDGGYGAWQLPASWQKTTATKRTHWLAAGYTYCFKVRAYDRLGNTSAWSLPTCTARTLDDRGLAAGARWQRSSGHRFYLDTVTSTTAHGAQAWLGDARVRSLGVVVTRCPTGGSIRVSIAGAVVGDVDLHAAVRHRQRLVLLPPMSGLQSGKVVIKVTSPTGQLVQLDGIVLSRA